MVKNVWVQPQTVVQQFVANEYVAACGDLNKVYKFKCDAGGGVSGSVYLETNGEDGLQTRGQWVGGWGGHWVPADEYLSGYHACGTTHEAKTTDDFLDGYYVTSSWFGGTKTTPVIVWRGPNNDNTHCTENLNMDSWPTDKS